MISRHPIRFGTLSSLRGTGLSVSVDPASAAIDRAEYDVTREIAFRASQVSAAFDRAEYDVTREIAFRASQVSAAFDRAEYDVTREIAFRATAAFAQLYAEAYPDVSGGVVVVFEEVYPI